MGILEKISEIEKEIARTQKNKATEYHLGLLKAKLAKYRAQLLEPSKSASSKGEGFDVMKSGDARVALIGFPSVGKSTFLSLMTSTASEAASYEFTTLTCIPGVIEYKGANIQLLDLPGIIEGAAQGRGRGRQVIAVARTADVVVMMLDATKGDVQRSLLEKELESVGIRLNKHKPNIYFKPKKGGGISFNSTVTLTQCSEKLVQLILHEYSILPGVLRAWGQWLGLRLSHTVGSWLPDSSLDVQGIEMRGFLKLSELIELHKQIVTRSLWPVHLTAWSPLKDTWGRQCTACP
ncbi:developmentally-regulated GTP-binding protein 2 isoform X2 [Cricetulus griseus]|uniref:Developmentally-regulated GTP-binding protein 2 isoform X2 n=1 Tax=Cricetulus griseus TaxID=10029 RepID=A0A9J7KBR5_CRIGR|nr:developmentally-regulated GTP-binding protein 2 isoform X2 [Cricetulus griseus]XP_035316168.1 developmentally-regulated GTP-binding protein 2 isoform X2 [Cricetulus griseus]